MHVLMEKRGFFCRLDKSNQTAAPILVAFFLYYVLLSSILDLIQLSMSAGSRHSCRHHDGCLLSAAQAREHVQAGRPQPFWLGWKRCGALRLPQPRSGEGSAVRCSAPLTGKSPNAKACCSKEGVTSELYPEYKGNRCCASLTGRFCRTATLELYGTSYPCCVASWLQEKLTAFRLFY